MGERILVDEMVFAKGGDVFRATTDLAFSPAPREETQLAEMIRQHGCRAVIVGTAKYQDDLYRALHEQAAGRPALIARFGVGHDGIDKPLARQLGIVVTNSPGTLARSVAEHALGLMLALARHLAAGDAAMRAGEFAAPVGIELFGKRLVLVGFGGIAQTLARMAHFGLGMHVVAVGRRTADELEQALPEPLDSFLARHGVAEYTHRLDQALTQAEVVSLHVPSGPATRHLIDAPQLALLPTSALLVNTARGSVINEAALYAALAAGTIRGAALDVFEHEPYVPISADCDLRTLPNVVLSPHTGSHTAEANRRMAESCVRTLRNFFAGRLDELPRVD
jgi:lactate dehydrogenase-like 2-hydroxyacid dehydrogenase